MVRFFRILLVLPAFLASAALGQAPTATPSVIVIGNIGDFGDDNQPELDVSNLVKSWAPDLITTNGDNNYDFGQLSTIDDNIGKYYQEYIGDYQGSYGPGAPFNRFFLVLGNHDWDSGASPYGCQPYLDWFTLPSGPGNERYYEFSWGPARFFMVDSDPREPDGISSSSVQALWLQARLAAATECWKIVQMHHAPYSSCNSHGSYPVLQWPYEAWGASAVIAGHDHVYERLQVGGIPYFVNGTGGRPLNGFNPALPESQVRYSADYGAMRITASSSTLLFEYFNRAATPIDTHVVNCSIPTSTPSATSTLSSTPTLSATPTSSGTSTPTPSATSSATLTATASDSPTPSPTASPTPSATQMPATATATFTASPLPAGPWGVYPVPVVSGAPATLKLPPGASAGVRIRVYTVGARRVLNLTLPTVLPSGEVPLDLRDEKGEPLANGLYHVFVTQGKDSWLKKFVIFR